MFRLRSGSLESLPGFVVAPGSHSELVGWLRDVLAVSDRIAPLPLTVSKSLDARARPIGSQGALEVPAIALGPR